MARLTLEEQLSRAMEAERLLDGSDVFAEALLEVQLKIHRDWEKTKPDEAELRESLYFQLRAIAQAISVLQTYLNAGSVAVRELAKREGLQGDDESRASV
jgi:hypothetical protein